ncbi:AmmeMemoRadiSam system protein A [Candidatus Woesearchaeota archaeon]|nr:AmmeMemoRadiSam system protein A [Candidatus Woesearchaeota archaeon]
MTHPLVRLAKDAITSSLTGKAITLPEGYDEREGCFVTITKHGQLRGCIGYVTTDKPLKEAVREAARGAALHDPRFPPLREDELPDITVEVSVLSTPKHIATEDPGDKELSFIPGKTGLIVQRGWRSGLLLPQVFGKDATPQEALAMTCEKAGLPRDAWRHNETQVFTFTATVLGEE